MTGEVERGDLVQGFSDEGLGRKLQSKESELQVPALKRKWLASLLRGLKRRESSQIGNHQPIDVTQTDI